MSGLAMPDTTAASVDAPVPSSSISVPAHFQSFLAFDYGARRTGVASGNRLLLAATPQATLCTMGEARLAEIAARIREWQPDALVVGVPYHPDGAPHENTRAAQKFARQLHGRFKLPVYEVDERYSTTEALADAARSRGVSGSRARDPVAASACIILEQFLRSLE
jgi:putative Holliday junction resolvase